MTPVTRLTRALAAAATGLVLLAACSSDPAPAPSPAPSPSPSPSPAPSPTPEGNAAPLTGELVDELVLDRPALAVKIENTAKARPQAGLETADIVIEELVEGGVTRFFAVFQSEVPEEVGPIRSARLVDATLLPAFDGILLYSGGRPDVEASIAGTAVLMTEGDGGVYRQSGRSAPSNLFAEGQAVYDAARERAGDELGPPPPWFTFDGNAVPAGGTSGRAIDISMSTQSVTNWVFSAEEGGYLRSQNGSAQTTVSDDPVVAANVVVMGVDTYEGGCCDTAGSPYVVSKTVGTGRAIVLRDGEWFEAEWTREDPDSPLALTADGEPLPLKPGATWIHLTPNDRLPDAPAAEGAAASPPEDA